MNCRDATTSAQLDRIESSLRQSRQELDRWNAILGIVNPKVYGKVDWLSTNFASGAYYLVFPSTPGSRYQVQESTDGLTWYVVDASVEADDSPAVITTFILAGTLSPRKFFRIFEKPRNILIPTYQPCVRNHLAPCDLRNDVIANLV